MNVGIPTEIKSDEQRVSLTPAGVAALRTHGHHVMVQAGAGVGSGFADSDYRKAGASIVTGARRRLAPLRSDLEGQGTAAAGISADAIGADPVYLSSSRRGPASVARTASPPRDGGRLRNHPARRLEPAAARADERSCGTARDPGRRMVPAGAQRRTRRAAERSVGRAARQGRRAGRRNLGPERMPGGGWCRRRSYDHGYQSDAAALPERSAGRARDDRDVESRDARRGSHQLRSRDWRGAGAGRARTAAVERQDGRADASGGGDRRFVDRPRWNRRDLARRRRMRGRPSSATASCTTASPTCPRWCRTLRPTRSPTRR